MDNGWMGFGTIMYFILYVCVESVVFHVIQQIMLFKWHIRLVWGSVM